MGLSRQFIRFASYFGAHHAPQRDAHERDRARQRVGIAGLFGLATGWQSWQVWQSGQTAALDALHLVVPLLSFAYAAYAVFHLKVVLARDRAGLASQYLFIVLDSLLTVIGLVGMPAVLAPLYPVLMVQIVRCGMRYGMRTLWLAWFTAAVSAVVLMPLSSFWWQDVQMLRSFAVMMLITPVLMGPLVRQLNQASEDLRAAAGADPLTGLGNRRLLAERLRLAQERNVHRGGLLALVLLDLDNFKTVNDSLGHAVGDQLLTEVAGALRSHCRSQDFAARVGGDEFVLLIEGLPVGERGRERAHEIASQVVAQIQAVAGQLAPGMPVSASAGLYCWVHDAAAPVSDTDLIAHADEAMYAAKRAGKAQVQMVPA